MKTNISLKKTFGMACLVVAFLFAGSGKCLFAEDTDVYRSLVKSNAMCTIDVSGSMDWPLYDHEIDYEAFFNWAIASGDAYDDGGLGNIVWDKNKIYLVSAYMGYAEITGEDGVTKYAVFGDPVYTGSTRRERWVSGGIIDTGWEITDWSSMANTIETVTVNGDGYVIYPTKYDNTKSDNDTAINGTDTVGYANASITGQRLLNHQDILLTDFHTDARTGVAKDYGFQGYLKAPGIYYAGLFETGSYYTMTDNPSAATSSGGLERVYAFVTGNYLSFIKLIEDLKGYGNCGSEAWRYMCYQAGNRVWHTVNIGAITNSQYGAASDYSAGLDETCGTMDLRQFVNRKRIQVYFGDLDVENSSGGGGCSCSNNNSNNDGVYLLDQDGNVLTQITEQIDEINNGLMFGCESSGWTGEYDVTNVDTITVMFHTDASGAHNCSGTDRGFAITKFQWSTQESASLPPGDDDAFKCCNGDDGVGYKIQSRLEVVQEAMLMCIEETSDKINWGVTRWSGSAISMLSQLGSNSNALYTAVHSLTAGGGTPMGEAMQTTYDFMYRYLDQHTETSECADNYMVVLTDGFPSGDTEWDLVKENTDPDPVFNTSDYKDGDSWTGDPTQTTDPNYSDDVARWMSRGKCATNTDTGGTPPDFSIITHTVGLGLDSPLMADVAEDGCGISLTANNKAELINAFYSLALAMEPTVAFTAPVVSVDEANRTESGDKLYMAFFKPKTGDYWQGNMKKYGLDWRVRSECGRNFSEWTVVDKNGLTAGDCDGQFRPNTISYWSDTTDGGEVDEGGVGGRLMAALEAADMVNDPYGFRRIYTTLDDSTLVAFTPDNITNAHLGVTTDEERYKIINFVYGYSYGADVANGYIPLARRNWILGDIVHSSPTILDYTDPIDGSLLYRYIAVSANDGMIHVFADEACTIGASSFAAGDEIFAFIPRDLLTKLQVLAIGDDHVYMVDGPSTLFRDYKFNDLDYDGIQETGEYNYKLLAFGERRGGTSFWALDATQPDPSVWTVKWHIDPSSSGFSEIGYTWSKPYFARIQVEQENPLYPDDAYRDVIIFSGGYDPVEDGYPEDFEDKDYDGFRDNGESYTDTAGGTAGQYDLYNPSGNTMGRGIFVMDTYGSILFNATYGATDVTIGGAQTYTDMKYCFAADPTVISLSKTKLLIYTSDIYGQVWKISYDYYADSETSYDYTSTTTTKWQVKRIFNANPGSDLATGSANIAGASFNTDDMGRKTFYPPEVSIGGNDWTDNNVIYLGTGDREHPRYAMTSNRFYTVADTDAPAYETDLLNLTCNELDKDADADGDGDVDVYDELKRKQLKCLYYSDRVWDSDEESCKKCSAILDTEQAKCGSPCQWLSSVGANKCRECKDIELQVNCTTPCVWDSTRKECSCPDTCTDCAVKGFFRVLDKQGDCTDGESLDHGGEKVLATPTLFYGNVYFTTYQPVFDDLCNPTGNAFIYAVDYSWGVSALNYDYTNDDPSSNEDTRNLSDTYRIIRGASIPSGVKIFMRHGKPAAVFSAGGGVPGAGEEGSTRIPGPPGGIVPMLWETE